MVMFDGVSVTCRFVAVDGPALATRSEKLIDSPSVNGPLVVSVLTTETSADAAAVPPLPVLSVLFDGSGSGSVADTVDVLSNDPTAVMVAVTLMGTFAPEARLAMGQGRAAHPPPLTLVMGRFDGVSVTCTFVAVAGPAFATTRGEVN